MKLTLGDTTLTLYLTPGHTEGTISTIIPVRDGNQRTCAAAWGGTLFNFGPIVRGSQAYAQSAERFRDIVTKAGADVMLSNHTVYDGSKTKLPAVLARKPGEKHPYVGRHRCRRRVSHGCECAQARRAGANRARRSAFTGPEGPVQLFGRKGLPLVFVPFGGQLMEAVPVKIVPRGFGETYRRDAWWVEPMIVFAVFGGFVVYATWAAFQNAHYTYGPYLSPFYSPELWGDSPHAWFGPKPAWWPALVPFSPALLILPFPGLFRFTCYYYRGAYYKAFWADPPSCAVGEPRKSYLGREIVPADPAERPPLLSCTCARASSCSCCPTTCGWRCGSPNPATGQTEFGIGVGTLSCWSTSCCWRLHARLPLDAPPGRRREGRRSRSRRCAKPATTARARSTAGTCCSPG